MSSAAFYATRGAYALAKNLSGIRSTRQDTAFLRSVHIAKVFYKTKEDNKIMVPPPPVFQVDDENKNKETFLEAIRIYTNRPGPRRGAVEFIYSAMKYMEEFGVHRDLQAYKNILDILPKGEYVATNMFQAEFMHYPKQQQCILDLFQQMEDNGVIPDAETETMVLNIFGRHAFPMKKLMRMAYWMPKFKNLSPWALPEKIPSDNLEIAKLAVQRMCSVDPASEVDVLQTKDVADAVDDTWIVSGQSATQRELLSRLGDKETVYVEGAFPIWLRRTCINYFILRSEPSASNASNQIEFENDDVGTLKSWLLGDENLTPKDVIVAPSVHEQEDGTILAVGVTGTCSKDSLLSWIRLLERKNPHLANLSVLFATYSPLGEVIPAIESSTPSSDDQRQITEGPNV